MRTAVTLDGYLFGRLRATRTPGNTPAPAALAARSHAERAGQPLLRAAATAIKVAAAAAPPNHPIAVPSPAWSRQKSRKLPEFGLQFRASMANPSSAPVTDSAVAPPIDRSTSVVARGRSAARGATTTALSARAAVSRATGLVPVSTGIWARAVPGRTVVQASTPSASAQYRRDIAVRTRTDITATSGVDATWVPDRLVPASLQAPYTTIPCDRPQDDTPRSGAHARRLCVTGLLRHVRTALFVMASAHTLPYSHVRRAQIILRSVEGEMATSVAPEKVRDIAGLYLNPPDKALVPRPSTERKGDCLQRRCSTYGASSVWCRGLRQSLGEYPSLATWHAA